MERAQVGWERAEEKGISFRESEWIVDLEVFLDEYTRWGWELPTGWWCYMKCSFMPQIEGRKRQNACSTEAAGAVYPNLNLGWTNPPWN